MNIEIKEDLGEYKKWVEVLTNYYEEDLNNCTMSNEAWIEQIAQSLSNPIKFRLDVIEYRKVEGRDLNCKELNKPLNK